MWASGTKAAGGAVAFSSYVKMSIRTVPQSIPSATWTKVEFNTKDYDNDDEADIAVNFRITFKTAGYRAVKATANMPGLAANKYCVLQLTKDGSSLWHNGDSAAVVTPQTLAPSAGQDQYFDVDDWLELWIYQTDIVARSIGDGTSLAAHRFA